MRILLWISSPMNYCWEQLKQFNFGWMEKTCSTCERFFLLRELMWSDDTWSLISAWIIYNASYNLCTYSFLLIYVKFYCYCRWVQRWCKSIYWATQTWRSIYCQRKRGCPCYSKWSCWWISIWREKNCNWCKLTQDQTRTHFPLTNSICKQLITCKTDSSCPSSLRGGGITSLLS